MKQTLQEQLFDLTGIEMPKEKKEYKKQEYQRGEVYMAELDGVGSEQRGIRPVVILQKNSFNRRSTTLVVACLTTKEKKDMNCHVKLGTGQTVLCEQIKTIDKERILGYNYTLTDYEMKMIEDAVRNHLLL